MVASHPATSMPRVRASEATRKRNTDFLKRLSTAARLRWGTWGEGAGDEDESEGTMRVRMR